MAGVVPGHGHRRLFDFQRYDPGRRVGSGMRNRTSINRVKTCRPAISRSPSGSFVFVPGPGLEPGSLRSERSGLPLADPEQRGPGRNRTPLARVRTECFAVKASGPFACDRSCRRLSARTNSGRLKRPVPILLGVDGKRSPSTRLIRIVGAAGLEPATGLRPNWFTASAFSFATRMHAPRSGSGDSFAVSM